MLNKKELYTNIKKVLWVLLIACLSFPVSASAQKQATTKRPMKVYLNSKMHVIPAPDKYGIYATLMYSDEHIIANVHNSRDELVYRLQLSELTKDTCIYDGWQEHYYFGELRDTYRFTNNVETEHTFYRDGLPIFREPLQIGDTIWYYYRTMCFREEASAYSVVEQINATTGIVKVKKYKLPSHELMEEFTYSKLSYKEQKFTGRQYRYYKGKKRFMYNYNTNGQLQDKYMLDTLGKVICSTSYIKRTADSTIITERYNERKYFYPDGHVKAKKCRNGNGELEVQYFMSDGSLSIQSTIDDLPTFEYDEDYAYYNADQNPVFPGGQKAFNAYFLQNCKYPIDAVQKGISGTVIVSFTVEKDGKISDVVVLHPVHKLLNDEAVRFVQSMPNWIPGKEDGQVVRVRREVPVNFRLK